MVEIVNKRVLEGGSAKFECQFSGTPIPGTKYPRVQNHICQTKYQNVDIREKKNLLVINSLHKSIILNNIMVNKNCVPSRYFVVSQHEIS